MGNKLQKGVDPEQLVLLECLLSNQNLFVKTIGILKSEYFSPPLNRVIPFLKDYFNKYHTIPKPEFIKRDTGVEITLKVIQEEDIPYLSEIIEKHCRNSAVLNAAKKVADYVEDDDVLSIEREFKNALLVSLDKHIGINIFDNPVCRLEKMEESLDERSIGWDNIDNLIDHIRREEMIMFGANSGVGKSLLLQNIAINLISQKLNGLYITLELSENLVAKRMDAMITGIPIYKVFPKRKEISEWYNDNENEYGKIFIKRMPSGTSPLNIRQYLNDFYMQTNFKPDFLCLDYLDILGTNTTIKGNAFDIDKAKSEDLREIIMDFQMYGFTASQLNRDAINMDKHHQGHIAGGLSKINTADTVVSVSRDKENIRKYIFEPLKLRNTSWKEDTPALVLDSKTLRLVEECEDDKSTDKPVDNVKNELKEKLLNMNRKNK